MEERNKRRIWAGVLMILCLSIGYEVGYYKAHYINYISSIKRDNRELNVGDSSLVNITFYNPKHSYQDLFVRVIDQQHIQSDTPQFWITVPASGYITKTIKITATGGGHGDFVESLQVIALEDNSNNIFYSDFIVIRDVR